MEVVLLCGGMGTRLREETEFRPKPMVAIGQRPILWHIMKTYAHFGHKDFVLCLGYKGEVIKEYFYHYELFTHNVTLQLGREHNMELHRAPGGGGEDWRITLVDTGAAALKGCRIKRTEPYITGPRFLLTYGDGVADIDLRALTAFHQRHGKLATVTGVRPRSAFGELATQDGRVTAFAEKPQMSRGIVNGGYFVFERAVYERLSLDENCDLEAGLLEELAAEGELMMYPHDGAWACMDTYRDVEYLNQLWNSNRAFWKVWA
jgi:glucose-1-phosphate cytidylyltransferase